MNDMTYDDMLRMALLTAAARGRDALYADAVVGRACKCGNCWCCAAWEAYHAHSGAGVICKVKE
jgi:hypothetical protein